MSLQQVGDLKNAPEPRKWLAPKLVRMQAGSAELDTNSAGPDDVDTFS